MNLEEEIDKLLQMCRWRSEALPQTLEYDKWVKQNRPWLNNQLRKIGKKYKLVWNVKDNRFVEIRIV